MENHLEKGYIFRKRGVSFIHRKNGHNIQKESYNSLEECKINLSEFQTK
jgi:hypothetical protein